MSAVEELSMLKELRNNSTLSRSLHRGFVSSFLFLWNSVLFHCLLVVSGVVGLDDAYTSETHGQDLMICQK